MRKIIEYQLISQQTEKWINITANELIREGFQPYGRPFERGNNICQLMVKYIDEEIDDR